MIWDSYKRTRWVIAFFSLAVTPVWLTIAVLETVTIGPSGEFLWRSPFEHPGVQSEWLMCFQSMLLITVCAQCFGRRRAALIATLVLDAVWLIAAGCFVSYFFDLHLTGFIALPFAGAALLMLMAAPALFFVTYLLTRTARDANEHGWKWEA